MQNSVKSFTLIAPGWSRVRPPAASCGAPLGRPCSTFPRKSHSTARAEGQESCWKWDLEICKQHSERPQTVRVCRECHRSLLLLLSGPAGARWHIPIAQLDPCNSSQTFLASSVLWGAVIFNCAHPPRRALRQGGSFTLIFTRILMHIKARCYY